MKIELTNEQKAQIRDILRKLLDDIYISDKRRSRYLDGMALKPSAHKELTELVFSQWGLDEEFTEAVVLDWVEKRQHQTPDEVLFERCFEDAVMGDLDKSTKRATYILNS